MAEPLPFEFAHVPLSNFAFEGQNNCYVLGTEADATTTLVDTGDAYPSTEEHLREELDSLGLEFADVEQVLLTHWHEDHAGLAGTIQDESGAVVRVHEADAAIVSGDERSEEAMRGEMEARLLEWGVPEGPREELLDVLEASDARGNPPNVEPFSGGERFDLGPVTLEAVHLPGHTEGLSGFAFESPRGRELFSGDALLPYYTPNVGGADTRVEAPLAKYLETLSHIVETGYARAWPGHRGAIIDPPGRAADVIAHHLERTRRIVDYLAGGPADPWTVSAHLFGDLESIHILHGPGESFAHLDHLAAAGLVERSGGEYALAVSDPGVEGLFPTVEGHRTVRD
jgi:hydroxyacylglutathione hydrolase